MKTGVYSLLFAALCMIAGAAWAAADPTRPPAAWLGTVDATVIESGGQRLQSVLLPSQGKGVAVIGGKTVVLGGRLGEDRLIRLTEREAVLDGPEGVTHLYLTPDVNKQMIVPAGLRKPGKTGHGKDSR